MAVPLSCRLRGSEHREDILIGCRAVEDGHRAPEHQEDVLIGCRGVGDGQRAPEGVCDIVSSNHAFPEEAVGSLWSTPGLPLCGWRLLTEAWIYA